MYMDSSPTSMQSQWNNIHRAPLPVLEHGLNVFGANGYLNSSSQCMTQMGIIGGCDGFFGDHNNGGGGGGGVLLGVADNIGAEGELFVPPLETEESFKSERSIHGRNCNNGNYFNTSTNTNNVVAKINNSDNVKSENLAGGVESCFQDDQDQLIIGDWDFEDLMKDVSSFPFLDFQ